MINDLLAATILRNFFIPVDPTEQQARFLVLHALEAFFGGQLGGGKSVALLMGALQFVQVPGYAALILRKSYTDLALPGALIDVSHQWLENTPATWNDREKVWTFPGGATLNFGYIDSESDKYRYQSSAYQYIAFDELTQFTRDSYLYLFSRLRRLEGSHIPLRMRSASNPGGIGHPWVKERFITSPEGRVFIPARLEDNPFLNIATYEESLRQLDPVTRAQLRDGDWDIVANEGQMFRRDFFEFVDEIPPGRKVRFWDLAATEPKAGKDPAYTCGALMTEAKGVFFILDIVRMRGRPQLVEETIKRTAESDGTATEILMEQEPGASGVSLIDHYAREVLKGYTFHGLRSTGPKIVRAQPFSAACENGNVKMLRRSWSSEIFDELELFPVAPHDDVIDALSGAHKALSEGGPWELSEIAEPSVFSPMYVEPFEPSSGDY